MSNKFTPAELALISRRIKAINEGRILHPGQKRVISSIFQKGCKRILILAGRSWGKSMVSMYAASRLACIPGKAAFIIGPTRKQQKEIMWEPTDGIKSYFPKEFNATFAETEQRVELPWQSFIKIDGSENHQSFRGTPYDLMVIDEAQDFDWRFYEAAYFNLSKRNGTLVVIGTMSIDLENPFMKLWMEALRDPDWLVINAPSSDNPAPQVQAWLKSEKPKYLARGDGARWSREVECKYETGGLEAVIPMFDRNIHVKPPDWFRPRLEVGRRHIEHWTLFDPGTKSVFGILYSALNRDTGEVYLLDEVYERNPARTTNRVIWERNQVIEHANYLDNRPVHRYYDEAAAWFAVNIAAEFGIGLSPTTKSSRDKLDDISVIKDAFLAGKLYISEKCVNLISEITSWRTDAEGKIVDGKDHLLDCLRYFFRMSNYSLQPAPKDYDLFALGDRVSRTQSMEEFAPRFDTEVDTSLNEDIWLS